MKTEKNPKQFNMLLVDKLEMTFEHILAGPRYMEYLAAVLHGHQQRNTGNHSNMKVCPPITSELLVHAIATAGDSRY